MKTIRALAAITLANAAWYLGDVIEFIGTSLDQSTWEQETERLYSQDIDVEWHDL